MIPYNFIYRDIAEGEARILPCRVLKRNGSIWMIELKDGRILHVPKQRVERIFS